MAAVAGHLWATELLQFYEHADMTVKQNPDSHCSLRAICVFFFFLTASVLRKLVILRCTGVLLLCSVNCDVLISSKDRQLFLSSFSSHHLSV